MFVALLPICRSSHPFETWGCVLP